MPKEHFSARFSQMEILSTVEPRSFLRAPSVISVVPRSSGRASAYEKSLEGVPGFRSQNSTQCS
jgi:hypothetical protein